MELKHCILSNLYQVARFLVTGVIKINAHYEPCKASNFVWYRIDY